MITTLFAAFFLIIPGSILATLARADRPTLVLFVTYSLGIFLINVVLGNAIGGVSSLIWLYLIELVAFSIGVYIRYETRKAWIASLANLFSSRNLLWVPFLIISIGSGLYLWVVGGYFEIPSDVYEHLGRVSRLVHRMEQGHIDLYSPWHLFIAFCLSLSGDSVHQLVVPFSYVAMVWILYAFFNISLEIVTAESASAGSKITFGLISTFVVALTFGTSVFAFIRYYIFAPVLVTYPIYLYFAVRLCRNLSDASLASLYRNQTAWLTVVGLCVLYFFHRQEALFLLLVIYGVGFIRSAKALNGIVRQEKPFKLYSTYSIEALAFSIVTIGLLIFALLPQEQQSSLSNNTIDIGAVLELPYHALISDPGGRVFETVGLFGIVSVIIYISCLNKASRQLSLSLLLLIPGLLLFNPVFVSGFLKVSEQDVIWRLSYMVPLGLLIPYVVFSLTNGFKVWRARAIVVGLVGLGLLFPIGILDSVQQHRYTTLKKNRSGNDFRMWNDLLSELRKYRHRHVLTDPITGYVLSAMTENRTFGFKFHGGREFINLNVPEYGYDSFAGYVGWLIVINRRDGHLSEAGQASRHWPADVMAVSKFYSRELIAFLDNPPNHIKIKWENDRAAIYEVVDP